MALATATHLKMRLVLTTPGLRRAQSVIEDRIRILEEGDYWGYNQHYVQAKNDARDTGQVFP